MKFSQNVLTAVGGKGQTIASCLAYNQKDFWNLSFNSQTQTNGWGGTTSPLDLTGATITAEIIRRSITDYGDTRTGLDFNIHDYPLPAELGTVTVINTNQLTVESTALLYADQPIVFTGDTLFGGVAQYTTYYVKQVISPTLFTISTTQGGGVMTLSNSTGSMKVERAPASVISLPVSNRNDAAGTFTVTLDTSTWDLLAQDPDLQIDSDTPACFTGRLKVAYPAQGNQPAYDEIVYLLFLVSSDGVYN